MKLSKSLIVFVGLSLFGGVSLATNYPTIACPNLPNTNTCQLCFNGGGIYEGTSRYGIADDYINTTNSWYVGLQSENQNNVNSLTLQSSTLWSFPELKWIDDAANCGILGNNNFCATAAWYTNPQWGLYHMFAPKYTNTYLKAQ
ncbi:hypothetical protein FACS1894176_00660 [Bacteroidia bacterium]|nr:hypothetical protein FACS1894176_00660 [Bacteroidia bacterium]